MFRQSIAVSLSLVLVACAPPLKEVEDSGHSDTADTADTGDTGAIDTGAVDTGDTDVVDTDNDTDFPPMLWGSALNSTEQTQLSSAALGSLKLLAGSAVADRALHVRIEGLVAGDSLIVVQAPIAQATCSATPCFSPAQATKIGEYTATTTVVDAWISLDDLVPSADYHAITVLRLGGTPITSGTVVRQFVSPSPWFGAWADSFSGTLTADAFQIADSWGSVYALFNLLNGGNSIIARNGDANGFNPSKYSRFDFAEVGGVSYQCQSTYDAASLDDAVAAPAADATDPATAGCGATSFAWTVLTPATLDAAGSYDGGDTVLSDTLTTWNGVDFTTVTEGFPANWWIGFDAAADTFSRFDLFDDGVDLWLCAQSHADWLSARTTTADNTDLTTGCNGAAWSKLAP